MGLYLVYGMLFNAMFNPWVALYFPFPLNWVVYFFAFFVIPSALNFCAFQTTPSFLPIHWILTPMTFYAATFWLPGVFGMEPIGGSESGVVLSGFVFSAGLPFLLCASGSR